MSVHLKYKKNTILWTLNMGCFVSRQFLSPKVSIKGVLVFKVLSSKSEVYFWCALVCNIVQQPRWFFQTSSTGLSRWSRRRRTGPSDLGFFEAGWSFPVFMHPWNILSPRLIDYHHFFVQHYPPVTKLFSVRYSWYILLWSYVNICLCRPFMHIYKTMVNRPFNIWKFWKSFSIWIF